MQNFRIIDDELGIVALLIKVEVLILSSMKNLKIKSQKYRLKNKKFLGLFVLSFVVLFSLVSLPLFVSSAKAATGINKQINFQGKLVDNNGLNVADNTYTVVFSLYAVSSSGTVLWTESDSVTTKNGIFQVALGANTALPDNVAFNSDSLYLGIKVGADAEMTPRIRFTAVPYAFNSSSLDGVVATQSASGFTLTGGTSNLKTLTLNDSTIFNNGGLTLANGISVAASGADITIGSSIHPTAAGGLTIDTNGANSLGIGSSANAITFGGSNNPTYLFSGTGGLTVNGTSVTLGNSSSATIQTASGSNSGLTLLSEGSGNISLGQNAGNGNIIIQPNAGGQAALIIKDQGTGDLLTASAGATTKFTVSKTGAITSANYTNNGGVLYADTTGLISQTSAGSNGNCLVLSGTTPGWGSCITGAGQDMAQSTTTLTPATLAGTSTLLGTVSITPSTTTGDLWVQASTWTNSLSNNNQTLTWELRSGNNCSGTLLTSSASSLTSANASDGPSGFLSYVTANPGNSAQTFAICALSSLASGASAGGYATATIIDNSGPQGPQGIAGASDWQYNGPVISPNNLTMDLTLGGISTSSAKFAVLNMVGSGTPTASVSAQNANNSALVLAGDGSIQSVQNQTLILGGSTTGNIQFKPGNSGSSFYLTSNGTAGIGTTNPSATLDVRGNSATTPAASVSANTNFAAMVVDNKGSGDIFTASFSGMPRFTVASNGNVYIANTTRSVAFSSLGMLNILPNASNQRGIVLQGVAGQSVDLFDMYGSSGFVSGYDANGNETLSGNLNLSVAGQIATGNNVNLTLMPGGTGDVGVNVASGLLATLDVRGNSATTAVASVEGSTNFAALVVNNSGSGDLFTSSSSGITRFRMTNNGSTLFQGDTLTSIGSLGNNTTGVSESNQSAVINAIGDEGSLVPNSGFESAITANKTTNIASGPVADGWVATATMSAAVTRIASDSAKGNDSVMFKLNASQSTSVSSVCLPLNLRVSGTYNLNFWANTVTSASPVVRGWIDGYATEGNCQSNTSPTPFVQGNPTISTTNSWKVYGGGTAVTTSGTNKWGRVRISVNCPASCANANLILIDGIRLIETSNAVGVDYAENYPADPNDVPEAGDVVSLEASGTTSMVTRTKKTMDQATIGVVSTKPGYVLDDGQMPEPKVSVALAGRVPVKVSTINGAIHIGDYLASSNIPGVAVKAISAGQVIGTAMEDDTDTNTSDITDVTMFIKNTYFNGSSSNTGLTLSSGAQDASVLFSILQEVQSASDSALTTVSSGQVADGLNVLVSTIRDQIVGTASAFGKGSASSSASTFGEVMNSITAGGVATLPGDLRVKGNGLVEGVWHIAGTLFANDFIANGVADFFGNVIFHSGVTFENSPTFSSNTAGIAVIKKGMDHVDVKFSKSYDQTPVVNASITFNPLTPTPSETPDAMQKRQNELEKTLLADNIRFVVTNRTISGFSILLDKPAGEDIAFSWLALSVHNPIIFQSGNQNLLSPSPADISPSPIDTIIPTAATTSAGF